MRLSLQVTQGSNKGKGISIAKTEFVIGRDPSCNLRPASQAVSKRHCIVRMRNDQAFVEDLKSTNGTFINDDQVQGEREIHNGDRLRIGPLDFVVQMETAAQADKPTQVEKETRAPAAAPKPASAPATGKPAPAPAAAAKPAPVPPATKPAAKAPETVNDEDVASMLLSLSDEEAAAEGGPASDEYDAGSTVMQVLKPEELDQLQASSDKKPYRPAQAKQANDPNTSSAAKAILEKYRRRPKS